MISTALFVIRRSDPVGTISGKLPANTAMPIGTALKISAKDADTGENTFAKAALFADGFVTREVRTTSGSTDAEMVDQMMGLSLRETPFYSDANGTTFGTIEKALEFECEGNDYIYGSGTGSISSGTAAGTALSFIDGKLRVAQSDDYAQFRLVKQMTPETEGNVRLYVSAIEGYKVA